MGYVTDGAFSDTQYLTKRVTDDGRDGWPVEAGRYRLVAARACPWANRNKLTEMPVLWAYARDLFQTPGFGDTVDFTHIKRHYYCVHRDVNPTGIVPAGPDLSGWLTAHGRESLGGRPFGDGRPPGPPLPDEVVAPSRTAISERAAA